MVDEGLAHCSAPVLHQTIVAQSISPISLHKQACHSHIGRGELDFNWQGPVLSSSSYLLFLLHSVFDVTVSPPS